MCNDLSTITGQAPDSRMHHPEKLMLHTELSKQLPSRLVGGDWLKHAELLAQGNPAQDNAGMPNAHPVHVHLCKPADSSGCLQLNSS